MSDPAWYAEVDLRQLHLWVCTPCLDGACWCWGPPCRCACNDASPAEMALADRVWRLADGIGKAPAPLSVAPVAEIQEARRAVLEAGVREAYGGPGEAAGAHRRAA